MEKNLKKAVIIFHSNAYKIYKNIWIEKCLLSLNTQTDMDFDVIEICYDGSYTSVIKDFRDKLPNIFKTHVFFNEVLQNHAEAMNFLLDYCVENNYDCVFNTNLDDFYSSDRVEVQTQHIKQGIDIVSSNMMYIQDEDGEDKITTYFKFSEVNTKEGILNEFKKGYNVIAHPSVAYSKKFISENRYIPSEIPREDMLLWWRTVTNYNFYISDKYLLAYRIHEKQITKTTN